jgi:hypothetical protein
MRKPLFGKAIIAVLLLLFSLIAAAGIYLIIVSVYSPATS